MCLLEFRLDVYILDYLRKRNLNSLADSFQAEANVPERMLGVVLHSLAPLLFFFRFSVPLL